MTDPILVGEPTNTWSVADSVGTDVWAAMKAMAALTIAPEVLEINGHTHQLGSEGCDEHQLD